MEEIVKASLPWSDGSGPNMESPYKDLAAAIVLQAVKDYIAAIRKMWKPTVSVTKKRVLVMEQIEIEAFFHSPWYDTLCDINPDKVIRNCRLRAEEQEKAAIQKQNKRRIQKLLKEAGMNKDINDIEGIKESEDDSQ